MFLIFLTAFLAAAFALLSGFGLGTILTPVFLLFYQARIAIFLAAIIHLLNNLLKLTIFRRHVNFEIFKRFGILAILGALIGALSQAYMANSLLKKLVGVLLVILGVKEFIPSRFQFRIPKTIDPLGGFFSGFLGGLIGKQGAIRSTFLLNYDLSKEAFIATGVIIACVIDLVRIPVYWLSFGANLADSWQLLSFLIGITFLGTLVGNLLLKRFSIANFRRFVALAIVLMGIYLFL